jgi:Rrf2 family transcriptional regulator, nitric oxide-sensitive transcriptional repressor
MRLTRFTDYALRTLVFLGLRGEEGGRIREIAEHYGISENHLMKIVRELGRHGFVRTVRGRGGGLCLARPPEAIGIGEVVRAVEDDLALVECRSPEQSHCPILGACRLTGIVAEALDAFLGVLDRYTLAELIGPSDRLRALLDLPPETPPIRRAPQDAPA